MISKKGSMKYFLLLFFFISIKISALEVPYLTGRVVDDGNIISSNDQSILERILKNHEKDTTNQIVVLTIDSLEGEVLEEFAIKVAEKWKIGQK